MDDEAQDQDPGGFPLPDMGDGPVDVDEGRPAERGTAWERRLAEARAAREKVLAARAAEGLPAPALVARRPFEGERPSAHAAEATPRAPPSDDPLAGRPKPWEAAAGVGVHANVGTLRPEPAPGETDPSPDRVLILRDGDVPATVPAAPPGVSPVGNLRLPAGLRSTGVAVAAVLVGLGVGLVGGLSLDRFIDPNTAEAGAPARTDARAGDDGGDAAGAPGGDAADIVPVAEAARPADAPQPRIPVTPGSLAALAALPGEPTVPGAERRPGMVAAAAPSGLSTSPLAGADAPPTVAVRLSELSPRLFFGDGDRAASVPSLPEPKGVAPSMPQGAAAFIRPAAPSRTDPFDAADAAPWLVTRPARVPAGAAGLRGPEGDLSSDVLPGPAAPGADSRLASAPRPDEFAGASSADPVPAVDFAAVPQPVLLQPVIAGPPAAAGTEGPAGGPSADVREAAAPPELAAPVSGYAMPAASPDPSPPARIDSPTGRNPTGRRDVRLVGGNAADRRVLEAEGIEFAATVEAAFPAIRREVRFFHASDSLLAERIARELDAEPRDFSSFRPAPPEGRIEVLLPPE